MWPVTHLSCFVLTKTTQTHCTWGNCVYSQQNVQCWTVWLEHACYPVGIKKGLSLLPSFLKQFEFCFLLLSAALFVRFVCSESREREMQSERGWKDQKQSSLFCLSVTAASWFLSDMTTCWGLITGLIMLKILIGGNKNGILPLKIHHHVRPSPLRAPEQAFHTTND